MFFLRLRLPEFCVILSEQTYVLDGDIMLIQENLSVQEKLKILTDAAKYDVACTSSGVRRKGKAGSIGNTSEAGICHSFQRTADASPFSRFCLPTSVSMIANIV